MDLCPLPMLPILPLQRIIERTMAIYRTVSDAGWVIGPITLGWLKDVSGINSPFFLGAALLFVATICFASLAKETVSRNR